MFDIIGKLVMQKIGGIIAFEGDQAEVGQCRKKVVGLSAGSNRGRVGKLVFLLDELVPVGHGFP